MIKSKKKNKKIYRKYTDFINQADLNEPSTTAKLNITIDNFNTKGEVINPKAPCVVSSIDPEYTSYATKHTSFKKFNMKTDILRMREITRNKFMMYATQEMVLDRQRQEKYNEKVYNKIKDSITYTRKELENIQRESFNEMMATFKELEELKSIRLGDDLKKYEDEYQRTVVEVQEVYRRFLFLFKLINYFDDMNEYPEARNQLNTKYLTIEDMQNMNFHGIDSNKIRELTLLINDIVQPYLKRKNHLNSSIWIESYYKIHRKIFTFYRQFTELAMLNHIFSVIYQKFMKTYNRRIEKPMFLKNSEHVKVRTNCIKAKVLQSIADLEEEQKADITFMKIIGIVHVLWENVFQMENGKSASDVSRHGKSKNVNTQLLTTLQKIEQIHAKLLEIFSVFDKKEPKLIKLIVAQARAKINKENEMSRRALVKENRWKNWIEHYKKH